MKKSILLATSLLTFAPIFFGCQSVPENIPDDLDARQLIQLGQDNYDAHHYLAAKKYYNTVLERFGDDPKHYIEAKYELGHLFLKQKNYQMAYFNFTEILEIYKSIPAGLPASYKILCGIELAKIPKEKTAEFEAMANKNREEERKAQEAAEAKLERQKEEQAKKEREAAAARAAFEEAQNVQEPSAPDESESEPEAKPETKAESPENE